MNPGSIVECIHNFNVKGFKVKEVPIKGKIYTVRNVISYPGEGTCVLLEEIINPLDYCRHSGSFETGWGITGFRELLPPFDVLAEIAKAEKKRELVMHWNCRCHVIEKNH